MNAALQRAVLLLEQNRAADAETFVREALSQDNRDPEAYRVLAHVLLAQERLKEARQAAEEAVTLAPGVAGVHFTLGWVHLGAGRLSAAHEAFAEAIRLDPEDPSAHAADAATYLRENEWQKALDGANLALSLNPEEETAVHVRAVAQRQLGQHTDAYGTLEAALRRNPADSNLHAQLGYQRLHDGRRQEALQHFNEALRLDASNDDAREGLIMALKASNPIYGLLLRYLFFMSRLKVGARFGVIAGGWFIFRFAETRAESMGYPVVGEIIGFAWVFLIVLTWAGDSFFDLTLRLSPYGRHALTEDRKRFATFTGLALLASLLLGITSLFGDRSFAGAALGSLLLVAPIMVTSQARRDRRGLPAAIGLGAALLIVVGLTLTQISPEKQLGFGLLGLAILVLVAFTWLGNALTLRER